MDWSGQRTLRKTAQGDTVGGLSSISIPETVLNTGDCSKMFLMCVMMMMARLKQRRVMLVEIHLQKFTKKCKEYVIFF